MPRPLSLLPRPAGLMLRLVGSLVLTLWLVWLLADRLALLAPGEVIAALSGLPVWRLAAALLATAVSFWALGRYDGVAHRHFRTGLAARQARLCGMAAIGFSQFVGCGVLSGSFARWRMIGDLTPALALRLTTFVAITFLLALAFWASALCLIAPPLPGLRQTGVAGLALLLPITLVLFLLPRLRLGRFTLRLPSLRALGAILGWAALDLAAAAAVLWVLLPALSWTDLPLLMSAYVLALAAGLLSGAPGGLGAFELTLLALLPAIPGAELMAAVLAYRLIYVALPALAAVPLLLSPPDLRLGRQHRLPRRIHHHPPARPRAETAVVTQSRGYVLSGGFADMAVVETDQSLIMLFDPVCGGRHPDLYLLARRAAQRNLFALVYKCSARVAVSARRAGWRVRHVSDEATLVPADFTIAGSHRRQLRRKLRQAERAGLTVRRASTLPLTQMAAVDRLWQEANGRAWGLTMGRFAPDYLARQAVFLAWRGARLEGFVSFHRSRDEWCLDLMRTHPDAPEGTMHALVATALAATAAARVPRLSLAAVPAGRLGHRFDGLRQFKDSFAPRWQPLYMAAPGWTAIALAAADLARHVQAPPPLAAPDAQPAHDLDEEIEFASLTGT
ncbi:DUF2156 domain-containing protein [Ruegeria pomeroyi]|nr:phosphatidylglycerol lysyltransferase domain-containing protein [Ruegeria pomeroyi]NVK99484.1 DUF2156 domain-containing protein [Ruegeria pomeroyi]NVL00686.1 DUF2156 domain-containing protein [Ruegeria pomeroyi]QWV08737.1 DUF2156 domain-containing protein [Ruegeria pomeroyi]